MGEVITFTSGKGGVGKTTTTANVGAGLSLFEKKIILIDTDIGLRNLDVVMGLENRIVYNLVDVLTGKCRIKQAVIRDKKYPNLSVIPSACVRERDRLSGAAMRHLLEELKESYDYILIDSPAGIDSGFDLAVCGADRIVVVTTPQVASVHDADCVLRLLKRRNGVQPEILINSFRKQMAKDGNMLQISDICELLNAKLLGVVPEDDTIIVAQNHGESMMGHRSVSQDCYRNICRRILGEEIPISDYFKENGYFRRLFWKRNEAKTPSGKAPQKVIHL